MDLIAKTSHLPGIQLGYLTTLFGLALARPRCTLISGKWSQWCSVATARAATGDFLSVTERRKHSPLQVQQDYRLLLQLKWLTGRFIKFWNMSQSQLRFLIGSLARTHHHVRPTHQEREREMGLKDHKHSTGRQHFEPWDHLNTCDMAAAQWPLIKAGTFLYIKLKYQVSLHLELCLRLIFFLKRRPFVKLQMWIWLLQGLKLKQSSSV